MDASPATPRGRAHRILSASIAAALALGSGLALALAAPAGPASAAPGDVTITTPEYTQVTHSPFTFTGEASPGDAITVSSSVNDDCHAIADGIGEWSCDIVFTDSTDVTVVTASRDVDDGNPGTQESEGWEYYVSLPPDFDELLPGIVISNVDPTVITGSGAFPTATMNVTIDGAPCVGPPVDGAGNWTCTGPSRPDGDYPIVAQQDVGTAVSDPALATYRVDTTTFIPAIESPYDSSLAPVDIQSTDPTPTISGGAGTAEAYATVHVLADDFGTAPPVHPNGGASTPWCSANASATGAWSCTGAAMSVGHYWEISVYAEDLAGNTSGSPDDEFAILILPPPAPPPAPVPVPVPVAAVLKTLDFTFHVYGPDGAEVGESGLGAGDAISIEASGLPAGAVVSAELHSTPVVLGQSVAGADGRIRLTATVPADAVIGEHEIVVLASADGYSPRTLSRAVQVRDLKQIPPDQPEPPEEIKQLGDAPGEHSGAGTAGAVVGGGGFGDPTVFGTSLTSPFDAPAMSFVLSPAGLVLSGTIAIAFLLLVGFPAELLESTIRSNYDRAFGWLGRLREWVGRMLAPVARALSRPWVGTSITVLAAAVILGFADPGFGFTGASLRLVLAMVVSVVAINIGLSLVVMRVARRAFDVTAVLQPMPAALAIVVLSVLVSRLAGISPGFLFGIVLGIAYARELRLRDDARLGLLGVGLTIAAGLLAWLGYGAATALMSGEGFVNNLIIETLAAITLEALGTLLVALLPIEFLDGRTIFRWSKLAWAGAYAVAALVFVVVVLPLSDNWGTMSAPMFGWGTLFAVFAVVAIATWAIFRRRVSSSSRADAAPPRRGRR
ncbi:MAG: hypothetical protein KF727_07960 [Microbacteriaceae bacterium]|nr:hypothetical protein [Microbacteriaceae bacterium]